MPQGQEVVDSGERTRPVGGVHDIAAGRLVVIVDEHEWETCRSKLLDIVRQAPRPDDEPPIDHAVRQPRDVLRFLLAPVMRGAQHEVVFGDGDLLVHTLDDAQKERAVKAKGQQSNDTAAAAGQGPCRDMRDVAKVGHRGLHPEASGITDMGMAIDHPRHRGVRHTRHARDIEDGRSRRPIPAAGARRAHPTTRSCPRSLSHGHSIRVAIWYLQALSRRARLRNQADTDTLSESGWWRTGSACGPWALRHIWRRSNSAQ